jgi:hypothetical protein
MSLLDKASLIVTPNSYKESKLYSVVPNTTLGDMDVVRATTATRVNSAGLIEVVPRNLFTYSEQFDNSDWIKTNVTITTNATTAPNNTLTAEKVIATAIDSNHILSQSPVSFISNIAYSFSYYAKAAEYTKCGIRIGGPGYATTPLAAINLTNGSIISQQGFTSLSVTLINNGWYRILGTFTSGTGLTPNIQPLSDSYTIVANNFSYLGNGTSGIFAWGAQLEANTTATEYFPTTTRLNIPRIDYTNGSCPSLLVEPQRTNALTYSNDYSNVSWGKVGVTAVLGTQVNPEGIASTYSISNTTLGDSYLQKQGLSTTAGNYTMSVFVKNVDNVVSSQLMAVHLTQGSVTSQFTYTWATNTFALTGTNAISGSSVLLSNGWVRLSFTYSIGAGVVNHWARLYANNNLTITKSVLVYGFQNEAGTYPTSYIPTVASTVTRNADVISKTGISSLIGQTEGTIYAEIKVNKLIGIASRYIFHISDGTANNRIYIAFSGTSSNILRGRIFNGGTLQCSIDTSTITTTGTYKLALAYKNNDIVFYVNGVQIGVDTSATIPTCSRVDIGHNYAGASQLGDGITNTNIFKTRLTNTELQSLTTL